MAIYKLITALPHTLVNTSHYTIHCTLYQLSLIIWGLDLVYYVWPYEGFTNKGLRALIVDYIPLMCCGLSTVF